MRYVVPVVMLVLFLPETGGIGTTIFYIAGALLAVSAVALLIVKRRKQA